ncbi:Universal stress protein E [Pragia fontium]|uniref:universal stress protein UspE n=1 Tax=Pragia fontium TaxID=82985 RepID=UPI000E007ECD|nr:universal stress protein UspE [Pragia fontium]SUB82395.1 Universal stress protein E [Pragia fontium]
MAHYQNILVALEPEKEDQAALRRAVYLVRRNGGKIKAFLPIFDFSYEVTSLLSQDERMAMRQSAIDQRVAWIRHLSHHYLESGVNIEIKVVWHKRYHEAVIDEVASFNHDLLLKAAHQQDRLEAVIFTPVDWHLLRKCPCPVWMVKDQPWPEHGKALVSVNLSSDEDFHDELNKKLVKESLELAAFTDSTEVHLVSAYPSTSINIAIELPEFDPTVYNNAIRGQFLIAMKSLRQQFSIPEELTHVEKGMPEDVIPAVAEEIEAGIVVLGTVGRTGLSAAFIGNTAERVIGHIKCDLLVIKPDDTSEDDDHDDED